MEPALTTSPVSVEYRDLVADGPMVPQEDLPAAHRRLLRWSFVRSMAMTGPT